MTYGEQVVTLRKRKELSQGELGKLVGTSGDIIGKYERDEVKPSIEVASKIADALEVSLDYLVGKTSVEIDAKTLGRLRNIETRNNLSDRPEIFLQDSQNSTNSRREDRPGQDSPDFADSKPKSFIDSSFFSVEIKMCGVDQHCIKEYDDEVVDKVVCKHDQVIDYPALLSDCISIPSGEGKDSRWRGV